MKEKNKENKKIKESKVFKWFRRLASLGVGGALAYLFPNVLITNLSMLAGYLAGKGIITFGTAMAVSTFLGSAAGILVQQALIGGISYLFSNIILKQGGKLVRKIASKNKKIEEPLSVNQIAEPVVTKQAEKTATPIIPTVPVLERPHVKTLGVDPRTRR
mgnify:CR=1 FL=1